MEAGLTFLKLSLNCSREKQSQICSMGGAVSYLFLYLGGISYICSQQC